MKHKERGNGHKTETPDVSHIRNVEVTHERSDVSVRGVMSFVGVLIIAIGILHFAAPFLFLLSRGLKRDPGKLVMVALLILVMRAVDLLWVLVPAFRTRHWILLDVFALVGFGGLWLAFFTWQLGKRPLIPINDPQFESTLEQMHSHG